jgi:hypothetical protein
VFSAHVGSDLDYRLLGPIKRNLTRRRLMSTQVVETGYVIAALAEWGVPEK